MEDKLLESIEKAGEFSEEENIEAENPILIAKKNFHQISECLKGKIAYIDGGNAAIISTPSFALELIRLGYVIYDGMKRAESDVKEFYLLVKAEAKAGKMIYKAECFPISFRIDYMEFDPYDKRLRAGGERADIGAIGGVVRRLAEIIVMKEVIDKAAGGTVVKDGDLEVKYPYEGKLMMEALDKAKALKAGVCGLSKTSSLLTDKGNALIAKILSFGKEGEWHYYPLVEKEGSKAGVVKLHAKSRHAFRLDYIGERIEEALGLMKEHSKDISLIGYPYGLYEADRLARVSNNEKEYLAMKLMLRLRDQKKIEAMMNAGNFHSILDSIG